MTVCGQVVRPLLKSSQKIMKALPIKVSLSLIKVNKNMRTVSVLLCTSFEKLLPLSGGSFFSSITIF